MVPSLSAYMGSRKQFQSLVPPIVIENCVLDK
jgi:hypothetical protein